MDGEKERNIIETDRILPPTYCFQTKQKDDHC